ncbi:MAG TPA: class I SAM-dependent rRNA methyltransferase [Myxococcales bacterium]|nr:class I SAM-dependent rRNA methyltransferase [Myxococcales bacterium]
MASVVKLELQKDLARHLRAGHPWVFRRAVEKAPRGLDAGAVVDVTERGRFVARGYYDPQSHIAVRVLTLDPAEAIGSHFWRKRIARAVALRRAYVPFTDAAVTDCARLVHGEGDGLPGVVADLYGKVAVLKLYSAGLSPHRAHIVEALRGEVELTTVYGRDEETMPSGEEDETALEDDSGSSRAARGQVLWGAEPPDPVTVHENGVALAVDVRAGQKTGFFLDQRENRYALRRYARGVRRALNCFSYSGGFSLALALGGAREIGSVDRDAAALRLARRNFELNGIDPSPHRFEAADVHDFLRSGTGAPYDLIVLDPPAYAKTQKAVPAALDGYASLHRAALSALAPGGILATASCSARVTPDQFLGAIREAAVKTRADLTLLEERRQPPDHPIRLSFPEGRYLKFFVLRKGEA